MAQASSLRILDDLDGRQDAYCPGSHLCDFASTETRAGLSKFVQFNSCQIEFGRCDRMHETLLA